MTHISGGDARKGARPYLGFGLGLRSSHYVDVLESAPAVDWFEILTENYLVPGGRPVFYLDQIAERYPLVMHGVSLSVGGTDPLDQAYLANVKQLADRVEPKWISDHLCWTGVGGENLHDLLPLPYTEEAIDHVASRIRHAQDYLERPFLIENVSSYVSYSNSELSEWAFLDAVAERADCQVLLDINNIYVSAHNHDFDPMHYIRGVSAARVWQIHLAGHSYNGNLIVDTHDRAVPDPVWSLYERALDWLGPVSTMIERDDDIPPLSDLLDELTLARKLGSDPSRRASA